MDWLDTYNKYTEDSESPSIFHLWVAISTIASTLERKVWFQLMADLIYPNMFVILVAPPAQCRRSSCVSMGSRLLHEFPDIHVTSEKITPEAIIKRMSLCRTEFFKDDVIYEQCAVTCISKELSSLAGTDIEKMFELLCDLYDAQINEKWANETISRHVDSITGPLLNILGSTTPSFFKKPEVQAGIGSGFLSRCILLWAEEIRKRSLYIEDMPRHLDLKKQLIEGLFAIQQLRGEFVFTPEAKNTFDTWYLGLPKHQQVIEQLAAYHERKHMHIIKLCMILTAAKKQITIIDQEILELAFSYMTMAEHFTPRVFSGTGKSIHIEDISTILLQLQQSKKPLSYEQLWQRNSAKIRIDHFDMILQAVLRQGVKVKKTNNVNYFWWENEAEK